MKIKRIIVLINRDGTDIVSMELDATSPFPKTEDEAWARTETTPGLGIKWAKENFDCSIEVIDYNTGSRISK